MSLRLQQLTLSEEGVRLDDKYNFLAMSVLVVDESIFTRKLTGQIFRSFGFGFVREASSCALGFEMFKSNNIEIVCVETIMTEMSGNELIKTIRTSSESPNTVVPILATCSHPTVKNVSESRDAGATELVGKPFAPRAMLDRLVNMIEEPRQFVRSEDFFGPDRRRLALETYDGEERRVAPESNVIETDASAPDEIEPGRESSESSEVQNAAE